MNLYIASAHVANESNNEKNKYLETFEEYMKNDWALWVSKFPVNDEVAKLFYLSKHGNYTLDKAYANTKITSIIGTYVIDHNNQHSGFFDHFHSWVGNGAQDWSGHGWYGHPKP